MTIADGDKLDAGGLEIEAIYTPGHAAGHLAFLINGTDVFTADVLFKGTVGGTMAPGASGFEDLKASVMRLMELPPETRVHPGHNEPTTIGEECEGNPFVRIWRGLDATGEEQVTVWDRPATLKLWAPDYDGGNKAWIVFGDSGEDAIVGGSQVVAAEPYGTQPILRFDAFRWTYVRAPDENWLTGTAALSTLETTMPTLPALPLGSITEFFFDWYPVFGVFFMAALLAVFVLLLRSTWARPSRRRSRRARPSRSSGRRSRASTPPRTS